MLFCICCKRTVYEVGWANKIDLYIIPCTHIQCLGWLCATGFGSARITTLLRMSRRQGSFPYKFWDYAFLTSVYLINRLHTTALKFDTPYIKLFNLNSDYTLLKVFGCSCFLLLRPYNKHKLQFMSQECVFLGYSISHKGYKCLDVDGHMFPRLSSLMNITSRTHYCFPLQPLPLLKTHFSLNPSGYCTKANCSPGPNPHPLADSSLIITTSTLLP